MYSSIETSAASRFSACRWRRTRAVMSTEGFSAVALGGLVLDLDLPCRRTFLLLGIDLKTGLAQDGRQIDGRGVGRGDGLHRLGLGLGQRFRLWFRFWICFALGNRQFRFGGNGLGKRFVADRQRAPRRAIFDSHSPRSISSSRRCVSKALRSASKSAAHD